MSRSFEETRRMAADNISDMELHLARMTRTCNKYPKHGAVNAAAEPAPEMEALEREIAGEQEMYKPAFY
jgi:hypothetical protein